RVAERAPADLRLPCDVHGREAQRLEQADDAEVEELAVPCGCHQVSARDPTRRARRSARSALRSRAGRAPCAPGLRRTRRLPPAPGPAPVPRRSPTPAP